MLNSGDFATKQAWMRSLSYLQNKGMRCKSRLLTPVCLELTPTVSNGTYSPRRYAYVGTAPFAGSCLLEQGKLIPQPFPPNLPSFPGLILFSGLWSRGGSGAGSVPAFAINKSTLPSRCHKVISPPPTCGGGRGEEAYCLCF